MYTKLTAAAIVKITRQPPKRECQYVPIAIPKVNIPNLKIPVCHHFNVKVLKMFMRRASLRAESVNEFYPILLHKLAPNWSHSRGIEDRARFHSSGKRTWLKVIARAIV